MTISLDPIDLEVLSHRLREIVETMEHLLFHGGYSTVLRESYDGSASITDAGGRAVMCAGFPIHVACYAIAVRATVARYPLESMRPGDSFIANNPYVAGAMHAPDMVVITPAFHDGRVVAFCVSIAHKPDIGGLVPGSCPADAREVFHEGVLIGPARYYIDSAPDPGIESILVANSRTPEVVVGDVRSQVGCTQVGARRLVDLIDVHGRDVLERAFDLLIEGSELRVRRALAGLPDWSGSVVTPFRVAGVGVADTLVLHLAVEKRGDSLIVDLAGTSPQVAAPVNILPQAVEAAVFVSLVAFVDPTIPINEGVKNVIEIRNPRGSLTCPEFPAPVNHYFPVMYLLYCTMLKALGELEPGRGFATAGFDMGTVSFGFGMKGGQAAKVLYELLPPSLGATNQADGPFGVAIMIHFTPSASLEVIETEYPVTFRCFSVRPDSGGAGTYRGGVGYRREYTVDEACEATVRLSPLDLKGWGAGGGHEPPPGRASIQRADGTLQDVLGFSRHVLEPGDTVRIDVSGGGGWGPASERDPAHLADDVHDGYVTAAAAASIYRR